MSPRGLECLVLSPGCDVPERFGGKAVGLAELVRAGAAVPETLLLGFGNVGIAPTAEWIADFGRVLEDWIGTLSDARRGIIVRSSSQAEDAELASHAGLFPSEVLDPGAGAEAVASSVSRVASAIFQAGVGGHVGVVIQRYVVGDVGGVLFTSDPVSGDVREGLLSVAAGGAERVVQGGPDVLTQAVPQGRLPADIHPRIHAIWGELWGTGKRIEHAGGRPVDIEFTVDDSGRLWFLQSRSQASVVRVMHHVTALLPMQSTQPLPEPARSHPKAVLRQECARAGVPVTQGWLATATRGEIRTLEKLPAGSYSCVVLHPRLVGGRVLRKRGSRPLRLARELAASTSDFWFGQIGIFEFVDTEITGIASLSQGTTVVETSRSHLVAKGAGHSTVVTILPDGEVRVQGAGLVSLDQGEHAQLRDGCEDDGTLPMPRATLEELQAHVSRLAKRGWSHVEFTWCAARGLTVVDFQTGPVPPSPGLAADPPISLGSASGRAIRMPRPARDVTAEVHAHEFSKPGGTGGPVIVVCQRPELGHMMNIQRLQRRGYVLVGMVFVEYAPLAHLCLLLREWGIPAAAVSDVHARVPRGAELSLRVGADDVQLTGIPRKRLGGSS